MVFYALPWTVGLSVATLLSFLIGNTIVPSMAWDRTPGILRTLLPATLTFTSIPFFMLGILLIHVFAFGLRWLPPSGAYGCGSTQGFNLPFITQRRLSCHPARTGHRRHLDGLMGHWDARTTITTAGEDYMILAEAKGLKPSRVFWLYGVRN